MNSFLFVNAFASAPADLLALVSATYHALRSGPSPMSHADALLIANAHLSS